MIVTVDLNFFRTPFPINPQNCFYKVCREIKGNCSKLMGPCIISHSVLGRKPFLLWWICSVSPKTRRQRSHRRLYLPRASDLLFSGRSPDSIWQEWGQHKLSECGVRRNTRQDIISTVLDEKTASFVSANSWFHYWLVSSIFTEKSENCPSYLSKAKCFCCLSDPTVRTQLHSVYYHCGQQQASKPLGIFQIRVLKMTQRIILLSK